MNLFFLEKIYLLKVEPKILPSASKLAAKTMKSPLVLIFNKIVPVETIHNVITK